MWLPVITPQQVSANINHVCRYANELSFEHRAGFLKSLNALQHVKLSFNYDEPDIYINFGDQLTKDIDSFLLISNQHQLPTNWQYTVEERILLLNKVESALQLLGNIDKDIINSIHQTIGTFICLKVKGFDGGSLSNLIGAIWIGLKIDKSKEDFAELILHEFVHNALFIDDMTNCIFLYDEQRMGENDGLITSSILKIKRGYDKAFHSAYVATTLSWFYYALGNIEKAAKLLKPVSITVEELYMKPGFLSEYGLKRLDDLNVYHEQLLKTIPYETAILY